MINTRLVIGGASGFWGEAPHATSQLLRTPGLGVLIYDYLAEITLSIMARARAKNPQAGFAPDFVTQALEPNLSDIAAKGIKVISNAGGMNPVACARAVTTVIKEAGLSLKVAVVSGDDLLPRVDEFQNSSEMFTGEAFPAASKVTSINAYLGAFPIAAALDAGADIVITGRCVDSALTLGACIHSFGWAAHDLDKLAAGSLAGHLLECGPQATGGNFTDWQEAGDLAEIGYPVAEIFAGGEVILTKPPQTSGCVTCATIAEQMLYEIGDPSAYQLPDVICDFANVTLAQIALDRIAVAGAKGHAPSGYLKVSTTYSDGWRAGYIFNFAGSNARQKAKAFAKTGLDRASAKLRAANLAPYPETCVETFGGAPTNTTYEEITLKAAVRHAEADPVNLFLKELMGAGLGAPPGLHGFTGAGRPKPSPVLRLFSSLIPSTKVGVTVDLGGQSIGYQPPAPPQSNYQPKAHPAPQITMKPDTTSPLEALAWARSGDKGNAANIGVIARHADLLPYIWHALGEDQVRSAIPFAKGAIHRFYLPGIHAMNVLLEGALNGGGVASLLNDAQGKAYAQRLLTIEIPVPAALLERVL